MGIKKLTSGDVLIEMKGVENAAMIDKPEKLASLGFHGQIYYETDKDGDKIKRKIIHSQIGSKQLGVRSQFLEDVFSPQKKSLGKVFVLRPKQPGMSSLLAEVATRWDPKISPKVAKEMPKNAEGKVALPTPFALVARETEVNWKTDKHNLSHALYRAFRAYLRNHTNFTDPKTNLALKAKPLSKHKGVSCDEFIFYSYKVAILESIFPSELPSGIINCMKEIEAYKTENKMTKLQAIPDKLFDAFVAEVQKYIPEDDKKYQQLSSPVKGTGLPHFSETAFKQPDDWEFVGFLCYVAIQKTDEKASINYEPYVVDYETYKKLSESTNSKNEKHVMIVTQEEIEQIERSSKKINLIGS